MKWIDLNALLVESPVLYGLLTFAAHNYSVKRCKRLNKGDYHKVVREHFRVPSIMDSIFINGRDEHFELHESNCIRTICNLYQYVDIHTLRIEEDEQSLKYKLSKIDRGEWDGNNDELNIQNHVFTEPVHLRLRSSTSVVLETCIFMKGLTIESLERRSLKVCLMNCIVLSQFSICRTSDHDALVIGYSFLESLLIPESESKKLGLHFLRLKKLH